MNTESIAKRLAELCRDGKGGQAHDELYADDAVNIEMDGLPPGMPTTTTGLAAIREKSRQFNETIETVHGGSVGDPIFVGNWFSVTMTMDVTFKQRGRVDMQEIGVYHVKNGKIVREQFFYDVG
ncbi:MAG: nuclear transport factor 2 family protein [Dokdonella sp.]|uniref:nuclear transport factor 2 family protein n=1 Tax=Dokdonella sp. TaxID=2291710 RepID=UPI003266FEE9